MKTKSSRFKQHKPYIVWHEIAGDLETPITASIKLREEGEPFFLLESVERGEHRGRYSIVGLEPDVVWNLEEEDIGEGVSEKTMDSFRELYKESQFELPHELPSMAAGLIGYMSYDAIRLTEPEVTDTNPDTIGIPLGLFMRPTIMVIFDSVTSSIYIIVTVWNPEEEADANEEAEKKIRSVIDKLKKGGVAKHYSDSEKPKLDIEFTSNFTKDEYCQMVEKAKEYIVAGDIFQVVPSQRFTADFKQSPFSFYRSLRHLNPSPYLFYLDFVDFQLIGSSPEIMVKLEDEIITNRPLAGTRKRGATREEDIALAKDLLSDQKEISEHLMLVDLARNDVGRVAKAGTVKVTQQMIIEYYSHVMHISSNVEGKISDGYDALDVLFASLPVGTTSGAPKIRAMQIIDELESEKRSFYAGCVGYFSANGMMDTCITLRTALIKDEKLYVQVGGGVTANSDPEAEYEETCNKAKALIIASKRANWFDI